MAPNLSLARSVKGMSTMDLSAHFTLRWQVRIMRPVIPRTGTRFRVCVSSVRAPDSRFLVITVIAASVEFGLPRFHSLNLDRNAGTFRFNSEV